MPEEECDAVVEELRADQEPELPALQARAAAARNEHAAFRLFAEAYCRIAGGPATDYGSNLGFVLARVAAFLEGRGSGCWEWNVAEDYHETLVELHAEAAVAIELQNSAEDPDWPALPEINAVAGALRRPLPRRDI